MGETASWTLNGTFGGNVSERDPSKGFEQLPTGGYVVKITGTEAYRKEGEEVARSVRFQTVVAEGEHAGQEMRIFLGSDMNKAGNQRSWKTALLSIGLPRAQVESGNVMFGADTFMGKKAFVYVKAADPNDPTSQSDRQFMTPETFKALVPGQVAGSAAATPPPAVKSGGARLTELLK